LSRTADDGRTEGDGMTFDAAGSLEELKIKLRQYAHPRADPPEARAALERALGRHNWP
jgi:hypothetical protein